MSGRLFSLLFALILPVCACAEGNNIRVVTVYDGSEILINSTSYCRTIDLNGYRPDNFNYSLQVVTTNETNQTQGIVTIAYQNSNNGRNWTDPTNIVAGISQTNSAVTNGHGFYTFSPGFFRYLRLKSTTSQTSVYLYGWLAIQ